MHNINDDPRCLKSCKLICDALLELLSENGNDLNQLSVSQIADRATVSRATFYRHFDGPIDVIIWMSNREVAGSVDSMPLLNNNYYLFCLTFFEYWVEHSDFLDILVSVNQTDVFLHSLEKYLNNVSEKIFHSSRLDSKYREYMISAWSATVWSILTRWCLRNKRENATELANIAMHILPKPR